MGETDNPPRANFLREGRFSIPSLDGLRAASIGIVFVGHTSIPFIIKGSTGVTVFFFLSGYLITTLLRKELQEKGEISFTGFYRRRLYRIVPPAALAIMTSIVLSVTGVISNTISFPGGLAAGFFLTNYWIIFQGRDGLPGGMNALWSLAVEEHYYLFFPILFALLFVLKSTRRPGIAVLVSVCIGILAWRSWLVFNGASWDRVYLATDTRVDSILWGSIFALALNPVFGDVGPPKSKGRAFGLLLGSAIVFWLVSKSPSWFDMSIGYTIQALALAGVFTSLITFPNSAIGRIFNSTLIVRVGVLSYSIYLFHRLAIMLVEEHFSSHIVIDTILALSLTIIIAIVIDKYVDKPLLRVRNRKRAPRPSPGLSRPGDSGR